MDFVVRGTARAPNGHRQDEASAADYRARSVVRGATSLGGLLVFLFLAGFGLGAGHAVEPAHQWHQLADMAATREARGFAIAFVSEAANDVLAVRNFHNQGIKRRN